jgi:hypothetical protein
LSGQDDMWQGVIRPYAGCGEPDLLLILDDLQVGKSVCVQQGALRHNPECPSGHTSLTTEQKMTLMKRIDRFDRAAFTIRLVVPPPPRHPKSIALYPEISAETFPDHPHLFRVDRHPAWPRFADPDGLCTYRPGSGEWVPGTSSLTTCLDYVALFLAKHVVWKRTRSRGEQPLWLGPDASHHPVILLQEVAVDGECRCGSGRAYGECHRARDLVVAGRLGARPAA